MDRKPGAPGSLYPERELVKTGLWGKRLPRRKWTKVRQATVGCNRNIQS